jgi:hypothetical protein
MFRPFVLCACVWALGCSSVSAQECLFDSGSPDYAGISKSDLSSTDPQRRLR